MFVRPFVPSLQNAFVPNSVCALVPNSVCAIVAQSAELVGAQRPFRQLPRSNHGNRTLFKLAIYYNLHSCTLTFAIRLSGTTLWAAPTIGQTDKSAFIVPKQTKHHIGIAYITCRPSSHGRTLLGVQNPRDGIEPHKGHTTVAELSSASGTTLHLPHHRRLGSSRNRPTQIAAAAAAAGSGARLRSVAATQRWSLP